MLLHPVGLSSAFWPVLAERMARSHKVVAVDLAGHGQSPDAARPGRMTDRLAEIAEVIDANGGRAAVVGVSFGGMIAMHLALARPELVSALVLAACPPAIPETSRQAILDRGRAAETGGMEAVTGETLARWFTPGFLSTDAVARVRERLLADKPAMFAAAWEAIATHDALPRLGAVTAPALVVAGESDLATPLAAKQTLAAAIPGARLKVIPGAPHMLQIERPEEFTALVADFLDGAGR